MWSTTSASINHLRRGYPMCGVLCYVCYVCYVWRVVLFVLRYFSSHRRQPL